MTQILFTFSVLIVFINIVIFDLDHNFEHVKKDIIIIIKMVCHFNENNYTFKEILFFKCINSKTITDSLLIFYHGNSDYN